MSCQQTPITTVWTPTTSNVPATGTVVLTSIITPSPSISTHLLTSCLSTRQALPTALLHVSDNPKRQSSSSKSKDELVLNTNTKTKSPIRREHDRSSFSFWNLLPLSPSTKQENVVGKRQNQVPSGLPSDCVSWTIKSSFSTPAVVPTTTLSTSVVVSTTQTTIWAPKETVWGGCESSSSTESATASTGASTSSSSTPAQTSEGPATTSESASASSVSAQPPPETSDTAEPSSQPEVSDTGPSASSAPTDSTSSTKIWVEETSRLNSMASALASEGTTSSMILSATLSTNATAVAAIPLSSASIAITTTSEVGIAPIAGLVTASTSILSSSTTSSSRGITISASADAGAATQGAMAVNDDPGRDKAVSVGATIGGIVGLIGIIALALMGMRYYMRWKRGNKRKTIKMRQSWYPPGYDGPDHFVPTPIEKDQDQGNNPAQYSFFSMNGKNAIAGGNGSIESNRKSRLFPAFKVPNIGLPFFPSHTKSNEQDDSDPGSSKRLTMPAIFAGPLSRLKPTNVFPSLSTPWSPRRQGQEPTTPLWAERYSDEPASAIFDGSQPSQPQPQGQQNRNRDVDPPRSIMIRPPGFDGVVGPPRIDYQPPQGHMSWGLPAAAAAGLGSRPKLEWGHSYAASSINPDPRKSVIPPVPLPTPQTRPFVPGPIIPSSPTEESVYSKRDSQRSGHESRHSRQSKQSFHSRRSIVPSPLPGLNRKPSRTSNPDLRSAILSRASASAASLGNWSMHSGASDHSIPALPEGGLRFDFPLPPTPSTRAPTMYQALVPPPPPPKQGQGQGNRALIPPSKRGSGGRKPVPNSSVFEYEDYTRESTVPQSETGRDGDRDTIRQTANWYEKPLWIWDGQSGPLPRIPTDHGMLDGSDWRQSQGQNRKSVKWDPADGVARAL